MKSLEVSENDEGFQEWKNSTTAKERRIEIVSFIFHAKLRFLQVVFLLKDGKYFSDHDCIDVYSAMSNNLVEKHEISSSLALKKMEKVFYNLSRHPNKMRSQYRHLPFDLKNVFKANGRLRTGVCPCRPICNCYGTVTQRLNHFFNKFEYPIIHVVSTFARQIKEWKAELGAYNCYLRPQHEIEQRIQEAIAREQRLGEQLAPLYKNVIRKSKKIVAKLRRERDRSPWRFY